MASRAMVSVMFTNSTWLPAGIFFNLRSSLQRKEASTAMVWQPMGTCRASSSAEPKASVEAAKRSARSKTPMAEPSMTENTDISATSPNRLSTSRP